MSDVTRILSQIESGDPSAAEQLLPLVYDELRKLAAAKMAQEKPGQTLQATALVHEAYLRLVDGGTAQHHGTAGGISLRRRPRRCGGCWSKTLAARQCQTGGGDLKRLELTTWIPPPDPLETICWPLDEALDGLRSEAPDCRTCQASLLCGHDPSARRPKGLGISPRNRLYSLGLCQSLAARELEARLGDAKPVRIDLGSQNSPILVRKLQSRLRIDSYGARTRPVMLHALERSKRSSSWPLTGRDSADRRRFLDEPVATTRRCASGSRP